MMKYLFVFLSAALLLLPAGCATTAIDTRRGIDHEIDALAEDFIARYKSRYERYVDEAKTTWVEIKRWAGVDNQRARRNLNRYMEMAGRMRFLVNFQDKTGAGVGDIERWVATEIDRIANHKADAEQDVASYNVQLAALKANNIEIDETSPLVDGLAKRKFELGALRGDQMEAKLMARELSAWEEDIAEVYRRAEQRQIAEDRARQQSLLLFLGGLQQINHSFQQQHQYNQQQFYQQQLLYELSKPTTCHTFGATTTCY